MILAIVSFNAWLIYTFGDGNMDKMVFTGPYKVGYKEFRTKEYGNEVSVFYPIDDVEYTNKKDLAGSKPFALRHGVKTLEGTRLIG
jgi:hypothetical protein